ncbi:MAG: tetratricopeptide repeat protein [Bryobacteraceae bacterium]
MAAFLLAGSRAIAAEWLKLTTPNFELFTTSGEKKGREAILYFEQVRDLFLRIRPGSLLNPLPVRLIAFQNEKEYKRFRFNDFASAYYIGGDTRDYIVMGDVGAGHFPVAVHEYSHLLIQHAGLKLPRWLDEGWADVNSTMTPERSRITIGSLIPGRMQTLNQTKWMSLAALTAVGPDSSEYNEKSKAGIFYAESWLLTHMLYLSNDYRLKFSEFVTKVTANSSEAAFREVYGKSLVDVQKDMEDYISSNTINIAVFDAKAGKSSERPRAQAASDLEAGLVQADLLNHIRKSSEAKEIYERLVRENPKSWEVEQALGYLAWRNRENRPATLHFARAVELGCDDGQALFDYAKLLQGDRASDALLKTVLTKAVELRPDLADARLLLGIHNYNTHDYAGAIDQLEKIKRVGPDRAASFYQVLAYSHLELGNRTAARPNAEKARQYASTPDDVLKAEELLRYVNTEPDLRAEGTLQRVECLGAQAKVHILASGKARTFLIADPSRLQLKKEGSPEIVCGEQKGEPVRVDYAVNTDASLNAEGIVHKMEIGTK